MRAGRPREEKRLARPSELMGSEDSTRARNEVAPTPGLSPLD